ncbi:MAG: SIS domain-containing protein [Dorea sp.]|jgi:6-phospho-3-hexuloisomerase|nr:SIS domain-containing protein [Dorea sp.]MDE6938850.1 SIS domain-containing protein [Lachnospiraceae bacterium]
MGYIETYEKYSRAIVEEHEKVFRMLDMGQLKEFMDAVIAAKRVFLHGTGREGISMRSFAMRLAHLGKPAFWLMDDTTVGMHEGDLFIITDGRGDVGIHRRIVKQAAKTGAKIAMITCLPEGNLAKNYADHILFVHASVYMAETADDPDAPKQHDVVPTEQPMGNQYEQHLYLLLDIITILLKDEMGLTYEDMEKNHRNIE